MSTEVPALRSRSRAGRRGRFAWAMGIVLAALALFSTGAAAVTLVQGPRVTDVQVDPAGAIAQSGSRVILTANQSLGEIDPGQVTVEPAVEHSVDASGRTVGVRFPAALDPATTYTVRVDGVRGLGGGPDGVLETTFTTPRAEVLVLERDAAGADVIRSAVIGGDEQAALFSADAIDDFRATSEFIVASVVDGESMKLVVVDRAQAERGCADDARCLVEVPLPGDGTIAGLQVSERGQLVGFTFTDRTVSEGSGRASVLFTGSLREAFEGRETLEPVEVAGAEPSIDRWRFVPETSSLLLNDFAGDLTLVSRTSDGSDASSFGVALGIEGVARSTYTAVIDRAADGLIELDLETGETRALDDIEHDGDLVLNHLVPTADGGTLRSYAHMNAQGLPEGMRIVHVAADGSVSDVDEVARGDALLQVCSSPSARYAAVVVAPDIASNPYDAAPQPLPQTLVTRIVDARTGERIQELSGFGISWCEVGPW